MRLGDGILLDIGSTTTDIVPLAGGLVCSQGNDDFGRLRRDEFIYTGVVRTPVCSLSEHVPFEGDWIRLTAEHFSTAADVCRLIGTLPDEANQQPTPDRASRSVPGGAPVVGAGSGRFLAARVANALGRSYRDFAELCTTDDQRVARQAADCAPAVAVAYLARMGREEELR